MKIETITAVALLGTLLLIPGPPLEAAGDAFGALDLDVTPEEAEVYVDGELVGIADNYDGFPEFLWLQEGTYDLVFYHPDYRTLARQYTIRAGLIIDVEDHMRPGRAVPPEELASNSTARRDERLRRDRERREESRRQERDRWDRDRWQREREYTRQEPSDDVGRVFLTVEPADAAIYLDGHFLGTGEELSQLSAGLLVTPGEHVLEAIHPSYDTETITFVVPPGDKVHLEVDLDA